MYREITRYIQPLNAKQRNAKLIILCSVGSPPSSVDCRKYVSPEQNVNTVEYWLNFSPSAFHLLSCVAMKTRLAIDWSKPWNLETSTSYFLTSVGQSMFSWNFPATLMRFSMSRLTQMHRFWGILEVYFGKLNYLILCISHKGKSKGWKSIIFWRGFLLFLLSTSSWIFCDCTCLLAVMGLNTTHSTRLEVKFTCQVYLDYAMNRNNHTN